MPNAPDTALDTTPDTTAPVTTIEGLARRTAAYRSLDLLLFETIGAWATADADQTSPGVRPFYAAWSQHHAWHAELWSSRHPNTPLSVLDEATADARARMEPVADVIGEMDTDAERLTFLAEHLLPQLMSVLTDHRERIDEHLDAPTARVLDLVLTDVCRDLESVQRLVAGRAVDTPTIDLAATLV